MRPAHRAASMALMVVFVLSSLITGTLGWQSLSQQAKNETQSQLIAYADVELTKLERDTEGNETITPVPGAAFSIFTSDGEPLGGRYITDEKGKIAVQLPAGSYYFEELAPSTGFTFDTDKTGQRIIRYPFTVTGEETEPVMVTAYNVRLQGTLSVQKVVENADNSPLTEEQKQQEFTFTVAFSDGGDYSYSIDDGEPQELSSDGTLTLKHGQTAVFESVPVGVAYSVAEQPVPDYTVSGTGHRGTITEDGCAAVFTNTYARSQTGSLTVSKEVTGTGADLQKEFTFTAVINGQTETFVLKHGESKTFFGLPVAATYTVTEADYTAEGYTATVAEYIGQITGNETVLLPFVNVYEPADEPGSLTVEKEVVGDNAAPDKEFEFTVIFSDSGTYPYSIDGGEPRQLTSGDALHLKHGQTAVFEEIPGGTAYTVKETGSGGYLAGVMEVSGVITGGSNAAVRFQNRTPDEPEEVAVLRVIKRLAGEYPEADENREFRFTIVIDGADMEFTLKPGEAREFEVPAGVQYEVREDDYYPEGYSQSVANGYGVTLSGQTVEVIVTNTFEKDRVQMEIEGEKTWELGGYDKSVLPEAITVRLMQDGLLAEEQQVTPDDNGQWRYRFTVPKYDAEGNEIRYTIEEAPLDCFTATYDGLNIVNTYIPPISVDPPVIRKVVEGESAPETQFSFLLKGESDAPMPEGADGGAKIIAITGSGEVELGRFIFEKAGVYIYTISELNGGEEEWRYDNALYTLTITVTQQEGRLTAAQSLVKNGQAAERIEFVNRYESDLGKDTVRIKGTKTWEHGDNPNPPDSITVEVYADGQLAVQRVVTARDGWGYAFEMTRYAADGHEIVYTIDEVDVPGYDKTLHGYDLVNTYRPDTPVDPDVPSKPDNPDSPQTGDTAPIGLCVALMLLSLGGLIVTALWGEKNARS